MPRAPLDQFLRDYDVNEVHSIEIAATAVRGDGRGALGDLARGAPREGADDAPKGRPAAVARRRGRRWRGDRILDAPLLDHFSLAGGFVVLSERPDQLVLGVVGRSVA